jgi:hypothetical protein
MAVSSPIEDLRAEARFHARSRTTPSGPFRPIVETFSTSSRARFARRRPVPLPSARLTPTGLRPSGPVRSGEGETDGSTPWVSCAQVRYVQRALVHDM